MTVLLQNTASTLRQALLDMLSFVEHHPKVINMTIMSVISDN